MNTSTLPDLSTRNADLGSLVDLLKRQADVKYDIVVPASKLSFVNGNLVVAGGAARISDYGVEEADAVLAPTDVFDEGASQRLGIPRQYLRTLRESGVTVVVSDATSEVAIEGGVETLLLDANVNGWLQSNPTRKFLVRGFRLDDPDEIGIARAITSDRYAPLDHLDGVLALLAGVQEAGVQVDIAGADLTERNLRLRVTAPQVTALAPVLLGNYRSPFSGRSGADLPVVFGGFEFRNSETGGGAFSIVPRIVFEVCSNGMTITKDALRKIHIGGRLDEGVIEWSHDTQQKSIELVTAQTRDAVKSFLDPAYVARVVAEIEQVSSTPVTDAVATIERVQKVHAFSDAETASILDAFIKGGDLTAGGVLNAVTAAAQSEDLDGDRAAELEDAALAVLATAAAI